MLGGSILFPVLVRVPFKKYALILLPYSVGRQSSHICTPCRACLLFFLQEHKVGRTWTIHWVPGPSLPLPVRLPGGQVQLALLQLCHSTSISNRVFIKSYRADVFTIRCCSFLFLNLFRPEEEECDLLTCWEPWHLVKNRYSLEFC